MRAITKRRCAQENDGLLLWKKVSYSFSYLSASITEFYFFWKDARALKKLEADS